MEVLWKSVGGPSEESKSFKVALVKLKQKVTHRQTDRHTDIWTPRAAVATKNATKLRRIQGRDVFQQQKFGANENSQLVKVCNETLSELSIV